MAKNNNLTDFLTDIANQIRTNDGITTTINPQDFSTKISNTVGENVAKQTATTYNTSTKDQTISAAQYLTGDQTIKAVTVSGVEATKMLDTATVKVGDENDDDRITKVTGTIETKTTATYNTSTTDQTINSGVYLGGDQTIKAVTVSGLDKAKMLDTATVKVGDENDDDRITSVTGTIETKTSSDLSASGKTVTVPIGYYAKACTKDVADGSVSVSGSAYQSTPSISIDSNGLITASVAATSGTAKATVTAGYISGDKTGTFTMNKSSNIKQLTTKGATTITPTSTTQTAVSAGTYVTGDITVSGVTTKGYEQYTEVDGWATSTRRVYISASGTNLVWGHRWVNSSGNTYSESGYGTSKTYDKASNLGMWFSFSSLTSSTIYVSVQYRAEDEEGSEEWHNIWYGNCYSCNVIVYNSSEPYYNVGKVTALLVG